MPKQTQKRSAASTLRMLLVLTPMSSLLAGCVTLGSGTRYVDTSCEAFRPITYSSRDTAETVYEVRAHNRAFDAICPETSK